MHACASELWPTMENMMIIQPLLTHKGTFWLPGSLPISEWFLSASGTQSGARIQTWISSNWIYTSQCSLLLPLQIYSKHLNILDHVTHVLSVLDETLIILRFDVKLVGWIGGTKFWNISTTAKLSKTKSHKVFATRPVCVRSQCLTF